MVLTSAPTYVATSEVLRRVGPFDLTPLRFLVAAAVLGAYLAWRRRGRWSISGASARDRWTVVAISLIGYGGYGTLLNLGQTTVPAGTASLLLNMSPVFAAALGALLLGERVSRRAVAGMALAVAGTTAVALMGSGAVGFDWNALTILAAALILSLFLIVQQPLLRRIDPIELVFWGCLIGGLATLPLAPFHLDPGQWQAGTWVALAALILSGTVLAYSFWNIALAATSVSEGGALLFAVPVFSLTFGWALLGQVPTIGAVIGGVVALAGVVIVTKAHRQQRGAGAGMPRLMAAPPVAEDVVPVELSGEDLLAITTAADAAAARVGARLVTVSLWRPESQDLVRVYTSLPELYRLGGISAHLGPEWAEQCIVRQESYLADSPADLTTDAFEHHDMLASLDLGAAINAVVSQGGKFVGCINLLDRAGSYTAADLNAVEEAAAPLGPLLDRIQRAESWNRGPAPETGAA
ncbi:hypothetical protein GCM10012320_34260 [Sinomonas cellulolyticus]|nr:hypothetical protein GCM10012320_34260 [Sinomonas sp. KCTC 49339]